jgi:hypothetical protein
MQRAHTTLRKSFGALFIGMFTAGFLTTFALIIGADIPIWGRTPIFMVRSLDDLREYCEMIAPVALYVFGFWGFGLLAVGVPAWLLLHWFSARTCAVAVGASVPLTFVGMLLLDRYLDVTDPVRLLAHAGLVAVIGGLVGYVIWRLAYGTPTKRPSSA